MSIDSILIDGTGKKNSAQVTPDNELKVIQTPYPPIAQQKIRPFRQYLTADGTASGSSDMRVDGSTTSVEFWVPASETADRYITVLVFEIADVNAVLSDFGNIAALTNGGELFYESEEGENTIADGLVSNWEYVKIGFGSPPVGATTSAFQASNVSSTSEGYSPIVRFVDWIPPFGLKLDLSTNQRLVHRVNDNCSAIDSFNCVAYGFDRFE